MLNKAASSYEVFLNRSTTRTDGGWMHFKINNDDYLQLPGSDNNVNIYKDTTISSTLTINGDLGWVLRRNSHWILRTQQFLQSFGHWHHFTKGLQTAGHGFNFHGMEQVTLGKQVCLLIVQM